MSAASGQASVKWSKSRKTPGYAVWLRSNELYQMCICRYRQAALACASSCR